MGRGMEMDGCGKCMKYSLFVANFFILLGGILVLAVGIWTLVDKSFLNELLGSDMYVSAAYIEIGTGAVVVIIAFMGCLGSLKEIKCMLLTYALLLFLIFVVLLVGGILAYVFRSDVKDKATSEMKTTLKKYDPNTDSTIKQTWDDTQSILKCCGINDPTDWYDNTHYSAGGQKVPKSCCKKDDNDNYMNCQNNPTTSNSWKSGCIDKTVMFVKDHGAVIGGVGIGIAFLMVMGILFSCLLAKLIKYKKRIHHR